MYNLTPLDVRNFFFTTYEKYKAQAPLSDLEKITISIVLEHPEYHSVLENKSKYLDYEWSAASGETNPFLHLSMHITIIEQLSINHPPQINQLYQQLCVKYGSEHEAFHQLMDCIAEMLWHAERKTSQPDINIYLECVKSKLGQKQ
jgi:hypothetical protein